MPIIQNEFCLVSPILLFHNKDSDDNDNTINLCDTTHFDSEDDYRTGCQNISHCSQQEQSYSGLCLPGRSSNSTYFWNNNNNNNNIKNLHQTFTNNIVFVFTCLNKSNFYFLIWLQGKEINFSLFSRKPQSQERFLTYWNWSIYLKLHAEWSCTDMVHACIFMPGFSAIVTLEQAADGKSFWISQAASHQKSL